MKKILIILLSLSVSVIFACSQTTLPSKSSQVQPLTGKDATSGKEAKAAWEET